MRILPVRPYQWFSLAIAVACLGIGIWAYPMLPEQVASHWNAAGEVDGHMSRFWGVFLMPIISFAMWLLLLVVPAIDPRSRNIDKFLLEFDRLIFGLFLFLAYVFGLTLAWNFGLRFNMSQMMVPALGLLFVMMGRMVGKAEPNFTAGIRTPWTLSSNTVWRKTHDLGGKLFMAAGIVSLLGLILPDLAIYLVLVSVMLVVAITIPYSFVLYRREQRSGKRSGDNAAANEPGDSL